MSESQNIEYKESWRDVYIISFALINGTCIYKNKACNYSLE